MTRVIGVDIGVSGALAVLDGDDLVVVHDMPCLNDGPQKRRTINPALLASLIKETNAAKAFVEFVGPRPKEGAVGAFAFGRSRGVVEGVLATLNIPIEFLTPPAWKRLVGVRAGKHGVKDAARSQAIRRWPSKAAMFARVKDDGRAEAALIAIAGLLRERPP
jgi:crossover junction endodeoxyribonuclease RuvC